MSIHRIVVLLEGLGIIACAILLCAGFLALGAPAPGRAVACCLVALPVGYFCADLLSGLIHWVCDSFGDADTPLWGPMLVAPFRRHHRAPLDITHIGLRENLGASALAGAVVLGLWSPQAVPGLVGTLARYAGLWCVAFAVLSNLFHRWAHLPRVHRPPWIQRLQAWRVILNPRAHAQHHRKPHRLNYCILSGWANPLCNRVPWPRLESWLARIGIGTNFD